jgi:hypothetical protein
VVDKAALLRQVRDILQDDAQPYRYPDETLVDAANLAIGEAWRLRPDLFFGPGLLTGLVPSLPDTGPAPLPGFLDTALVAFVSGWAELRDDQFTTDNRASILLQSFSNAMIRVRT